MALTVEVGEFVELFQWPTPNQSLGAAECDETGSRVREEMADVLIYLLRLADVLEIGLAHAVKEKDAPQC
jgi:NTP pyrophosphatase (non-canonical NTP hydrolase)